MKVSVNCDDEWIHGFVDWYYFNNQEHRVECRMRIDEVTVSDNESDPTIESIKSIEDLDRINDESDNYS